MMAKILIVMGVSGCGKSTIGQALATRLDCPFYDGDDFHPQANVDKMASGQPLDDTDRAPWLAALAQLASDHLARGQSAVIACSALKQTYRDQLRVNADVLFVYLEGSFDLIWQRMSERENHYMKAEMLQSQFATLEPPTADEALIVSIEQPVDAIVATIMDAVASYSD